MAAIFLVNSTARRPALSRGMVLTGAGVAMVPDLDLLIGTHRAYSHSVVAVAAVAIVAWVVLLALKHRSPGVAAMGLAGAYASHIFFDWLGRDTSNPVGLAVLLPFSSEYHISGFDIFSEVSRRYWAPREFVLGNLRAVTWELALLAPLLVLAWVVWSGASLRRGR
jgi:membrane-bound metal-dependent hydrolase YbcI (DUF457 family)